MDNLHNLGASSSIRRIRTWSCDPATFVGMPLILAAMALLANFVPAHRATRLDTAHAL